MARALPWILSGSAIAGYLWWRRSRSSQSATELSGRWVWPVPLWQGRHPTVSDGFNSPRHGLKRHGGVDIMYARTARDPYAVGSVNGSKGFVMPDNVSALAAYDGVVYSAGPSERGFEVVLDHSPNAQAATFYSHLERLLVQPTTHARSGQHVRAGEPLGIIGYSPVDSARLKHLHFELWHGGPLDAIDPEPLMQSWAAIDAQRELVARNASLVYRRVGASGEPYPHWVRALKGKAGVYLIREDDELVYIGSSAGRLYDTLTRHFQSWRRFKGFWKGQYGEGHDPGLTYQRARCEVAVRVTSASAAYDEEMRLIRLLEPRDNLVGQFADEVPF